MTKLYLGIDTSNYTTSIGVVDENNNIIVNLRRTLEVKENNRGLRQQEAVFQHLNNLPILINSLSNSIDFSKVETISVSTRPRDSIDSYMPVFVVGKNQGYILSEVLNTNYKEFSHQEGHIAAGLLNNSKKMDKFLSLHISGGTTEILLVENSLDNFNTTLIGGSLDISLGQLIDRIGVHLGFGFPCGNQLDELSKSGNLLKLDIPISIKDDSWSNLSGLENYFIKLIDSNKFKIEDVIITLFHTISKIIEILIINTVEKNPTDNILITGGVSANSYIRNYLSENIKLNIIFPKIEICTDNGIGIAFLGIDRIGHRGCKDETS